MYVPNGKDFYMTHTLGRLEPQDWKHVEKYPLMMTSTVAQVEDVLPLPHQYRIAYDQGVEGQCVGFSASWMMSILNRKFYDASWLYKEAQKVDGWEGEDYEGTSVRAGMDILRDVGHRHVWRKVSRLPSLDHGISANRWATTVDEIRGCVAAGVPVVMGTNWYSGFDAPIKRGREFWAPSNNIGHIRGGHAWCIYGASDRRQAFKMVNSWGDEYPLTWFSYDTIGRLLSEYGEATVVMDR